MKKVLSIILVIVLSATSLVSCAKPLPPLDSSDISDSGSKLETLEDETLKDETPKDETPKDETPKDETLKEEEPSVPSNHVYDNDCDADCNECKAIREVPDHIYDNACDADCNECKAIRPVPNHVYDNDCDADCNECKEIRQVSNHVYDNDCDVDCNECKEIRQVSDHVYDNDCDADCNECKAIRQVSDHVYDNACDADCNECQKIRQVPGHVYDNDFDVSCNVCKATRELSDRVVTFTPTNFAARFSQANEDLLAKILASPIKNASVENILPALPVIPSKKYPAGDGGYTYIYENVGKAVYDHCCATIAAAGYARYTTNEITGLALPDWYVYNPSMTLISDTAKIDIDLHTGMNRMYINVTPRSASVLPQREAKSYIKPEGNYPTMWVQYGLEDISNTESSMGYIIRIADGSFIIIDSGEYIDGVETRMYNILKKLAPDPNNIVISAWMITHAHSDHVGGFVKFLNKYANDKTIKLKQFLFNFPDDSKVTGEWEKHDQNWAKSLAKSWGAEMLKVHTGNVLYYADIKINILYTQENYLACNANGIMKEYNGASIVTQFVMADGTKVLVGADHPVDGTYEGANWCENALVKYYGTALESKVVSTFHHGYGGGANNVIYSVIKPKIVLWDVDDARVSAGSLTTVAHNTYFTTNGKANGVKYYTAGGSSVTVLQFANGNPSVKRYSTYNEFMAS